MNGRKVTYSHRNLELRAAEYYASIRKPEREWKSIEDLAPQLAEFEHRMLAEDYTGADQVLEIIRDRLYRWGYYHQLIALYNYLSENPIDPNIKFSSFYYLGKVYRRIGKVALAFRFCEKAMLLAQQNNNLEDEFLCLDNMGLCYRHWERNEQAILCFQKSLILAQRINQPVKQARALSQIAFTHKNLGNIEYALENHLKALDIVSQADNVKQKAVILGGLGQTHHALRQYSQAIETQKQSLNLHQRIGDRWGQAISLDTLGLVYRSIRKLKKAITFYRQSLEIAQEIEDRRAKSFALTWLGWAWLELHDFPESQICLVQAIAFNVIENKYYANLGLAISYLHRYFPSATDEFKKTTACCHDILEQTAAYKPRYVLATALVGQAVCAPHWSDTAQRADLLAPAFAEYHRALETTSAPGVVRDALRDLELIRAAGIEGLEPVFELLEGALHKTA